MNASDLKYNILLAHPDSHFFDRDTMKFFGDTMRNYGVRHTTIETSSGNVDVFELYRKRPVKNGLQKSAYFSKEDFSQVWPIRE